MLSSDEERRTGLFSTLSFFLFAILVFFSDEEEELAEAEQEDGQDVQEDVGEAEAAEEEGEVREVAQEDQEAGSSKRRPLESPLQGTTSRRPRSRFLEEESPNNKEALTRGSLQFVSQLLKSCQPHTFYLPEQPDHS